MALTLALTLTPTLVALALTLTLTAPHPNQARVALDALRAEKRRQEHAVADLRLDIQALDGPYPYPFFFP